MTREEKLRAMEALWEDLSRDEEAIAPPAWHAVVLAETERAVREGRATFNDWEEAKERIRKRVAKLG